jgi:hypothetical protein
MQEIMNVRGIWFLPSKPEIGIPGYLEYTPAKGPELQLIGIFEDGCDDNHKPG